MNLGNFAPLTLEHAMYACIFSDCSDCPLHGCKDLCVPDGETSRLFTAFADELVKVVLDYRGSEVVTRLVRKAIVNMYKNSI